MVGSLSRRIVVAVAFRVVCAARRPSATTEIYHEKPPLA